MRFAEELLLLLLNEETGSLVRVPDHSLQCVFAGSVLMDLALENRIDTDLTQLVLVDSTPVGDDLLDPTLAEIAREPDTHNADYWVMHIAKNADDIREKAIARLVERGILDPDVDGWLSLSRWVSRLRRYSSIDGEAEREVKLRIMGILFSDDIPSPRDIVIMGLANACGVFEHLLSRQERDQVQERIDLGSQMDLIGQSVSRAIRSTRRDEVPVVPLRAVRSWPRAKGLPLVGNLFGLLGDMCEFLTKQYVQLGPVFEVRAFQRKIVILAGIEANLFMARKGKSYLRSYESWGPFAKELDATRILTSMDGSEHFRLRRTLRDGFSRARIVDHLDTAVEIARREIDSWSLNVPIPAHYAFQRIVTEQIGILSCNMSPREYLDDLIIFIDGVLSTRLAQTRPAILLQRPRVRRARMRIDELYEKTLLDHQRTHARPENGKPDLIDDVLELHRMDMQFMPETNMKAAVLSPFIAGLDTAPAILSFMLYTLLKHPDLLAQARAEADALFAEGVSVQSLRKMDVTHRVALETLRMYPIGPGLHRVASNSFEFAGYIIPAGASVLVATAIPHYLPEYYPEPDLFDIDRYTPQRAEHKQPGAFAPFGLGPHLCLGNRFAEVQIALNIATILHEADLQLDPPDYELKLRWHPTLRPASNSFRIRMVQRR